jgi:hypothetical protein
MAPKLNSSYKKKCSAGGFFINAFIDFLEEFGFKRCHHVLMRGPNGSFLKSFVVN